MKTPASLKRHPIHPTLVRFPFALWTFSFVADCIYYFGGFNYVWQTVSYYTLVGGLVTGVAAAVPGIIDYFSIRDKRISAIAAWHARANALAMLLFAGSFYFRTDRGSRVVDGSLTIPMLVSLLGVMLIFASSYLGGEMVYRYRIGVEDERGPEPDDGLPRRAA